MIQKQAAIVHLWEGNPEYCWYPTAKSGLEDLGYAVTVPQMPNPDAPDQDTWVSVLREIVGDPTEDTSLIGHSIGAVTILRYLESLREDQKIGHAVLVAGFTDGMGYDVFSNFFTQPLDLETIATRADRFTVIVSDNDPYIDRRYGEELKDRLHGELIVKAALLHMSEGCNDLPDVVNAIAVHDAIKQ